MSHRHDTNTNQLYNGSDIQKQSNRTFEPKPHRDTIFASNFHRLTGEKLMKIDTELKLNYSTKADFGGKFIEFKLRKVKTGPI